MPRGRKKKNAAACESSTVIGMRDTCDWGRTLYDACYMFNASLAEYWVGYAAGYESGAQNGENDLKRADELDVRRLAVIGERNAKDKEKRDITRKANAAYQEYVRQATVGRLVSDWRGKMIAGEQGPSEYGLAVECRRILRSRYAELRRAQSNAEEECRKYNEAHLFETRDLANESRALRKHAEMHGMRMAHPISDDLVEMYDFIKSDKQAERLMGLCISIVNKYSEKEFCTTMNLMDREKVAERIYGFFKEFKHNYDFVTGCYEPGSDGLLRLKPWDVLESKFYNGYYMTIRGYVQRAYAGARDERNDLQSIEEKCERNANHSVNEDDDEAEAVMQYGSRPSDEFDDGMVSFWHDCRDFLRSRISEMADEVRAEMEARCPGMKFYRSSSEQDDRRMSNVMQRVIDGLDEELSERRSIGLKMKHIVLDALGGAETADEWKYCTSVVSDVLSWEMSEFFRQESSMVKDDDWVE